MIAHMDMQTEGWRTLLSGMNAGRMDDVLSSLALLAVTVEAGGGFERTVRLTGLASNEPRTVARMRQFVPVARGGANGSANLRQAWDSMIDQVRASADGRQMFADLQQTMAKLERQQTDA